MDRSSKVTMFDMDLQEQGTLLAEPLPRILPKTNDPNLAKRNRRMFGALIGTLEVDIPPLSCPRSHVLHCQYR